MTAGTTRREAHGELVLATRNRGKIAEFRNLLAPLGVHVLDLQDVGIPPDPAEDAVEDGDTFEANALAKARYFSARSGGRPVLADDSGLCVAALGGAPGVRSRRYAGVGGSEESVSRANCARLLDALDGVSDRRAEFVCALAYVAGAREVVEVGRTAGRILLSSSGGRGFGYDPLFWSDDLGRSFGEASNADKARVSHRGRAVAGMVARLRSESTRGGADRR